MEFIGEYRFNGSAQDVWLALVIVATLVITLWFNSNDLPWFFPLIALPLVTLLYWIFNR